MRNALVIAAREFEEKRFVAYAALSFAVLPFLIGAIPMSYGKSASEVIVLLAVILSTGFTAGLAVITGASFIGRDLSDGRMSFYFSRPLSAASIWFGKLIASIVLIAGCFGIIAAPARFIGTAWTGFWDVTFTQLTVLVLTTAIGLFLIAHVIGTFARSRSPLIAIDFAAAVVCGVAIWLLVMPLVAGLATYLVGWLLVALAAALTIGSIGGGVWQLERGRNDRRRNHLALSQFLWSVMAVALLIAAGFVAWVVSVEPSDLTRVMAWHAPGGRFLLLAGQTRHRADYHAAFLIDVEDGSVRKISGQTIHAMRLSRDGNSAFAVRSAHGASDLVVYKRGDAEPVDTGLTLSPSDPFFVSDDGSRIAVIGHGVLSVYDVSHKRSLVSVRVPGETPSYYRGSFVSSDLFRLYLATRKGVSIFELDARTRGFHQTGAFVNTVGFTLDPGAQRMLVRQHDGSMSLNDARTGATVKILTSGTAVFTARFLRDGRIAIVDEIPAKNPLVFDGSSFHTSIGPTLHIFSTDGVSQHDFPLERSVGEASFVGDDGTRLVLRTTTTGSRSPTSFRSRSLVALNLDRGVVERSETGVFDWTMIEASSDSRPPIQPLREVFYSDAAGRIVGWSPATGAKRVLTGGREAKVRQEKIHHAS
jgi:ABC-type transport system involved in multi-copper enzyme maturation permease subunit